jgi:hypothetical protein
MNTIYDYCTPDTLVTLSKNESTSDIIKQKVDDCLPDFVFCLISHVNEPLLKFILSGEYKNGLNREAVIGYLTSPIIASIFTHSKKKIELLVKYVNLSDECINEIMNEAEKNFDVDTYLYLAKYSKKE